MKVLLYHQVPFAFTHGGQQIQIERTGEALRQLGLKAEFLDWHDPAQTGEVLHFFGRMPKLVMKLAHQKGFKVVLADLRAEQAARPAWRLALQKVAMRTMEQVLPRNSTAVFNWASYRDADACVVVTPCEGRLLQEVFGAPGERIHVVPNGVEEVFLRSTPVPRGTWLLCTGTIAQVKRVVEVAQAAILAQTPIWFVGRPFSDADPYAQRFLDLARNHKEVIRYEGPIADRAKLVQVYREARGFVLLSQYESLSLSALEAAACQCPLLLSDQPWARTTFQDAASYCPLSAAPGVTARALRNFYAAAPSLPVPPKPLSWLEVAGRLKTVYEAVLSNGVRG
jgi:glycosyltransferase involved in cell wall biosynthesis